MNEIVMPKLSDTMTEGRLVSWKKRVGDPVQRGDVLAEVETDKANMELEVFTPGVLLEVRAQPGELVQVGTVIALVGSDDEKPGAAGPGGAEGAGTAPAQAGGAQAGAPAAPEAAKAGQPEAGEALRQAPPQDDPGTAAKPREAEPAAQVASQAAAGAAQPEHAAAPARAEQAAGPVAPETAPGQGEGAAPAASAQPGDAEAPAAPAGREAETVRAAPVVRRRARELGLDLTRVKGSGPEGRVLLQDLEGAPQGSGPAPMPPEPARGGPAPAAAEPEPEAAPEMGTQPLSRLRAAVAKTVSRSWDSIPHFSVTTEILMDDAEAIRGQLKECGFPISLNDLIVKASALALQKYPRLNASFGGDSITYHADVNISLAVGLPEGVLMPVVRECQRLSLLELSATARHLVERARNGELGEAEMSGGTFSVSNLGMFGVAQFDAIIYPGQCAVLSLGAVADAVAARDGEACLVRLMKATLTSDHRVADGLLAAQFLSELKSLLERPVQLLV